MKLKNKLSPIIKWAGGKEKEIPHILANIPSSFENYYEPFVGGGSVYTAFYSEKYFINDKSKELIDLYKSIATNNINFYDWLLEIIRSWEAMFKYVEYHSELIELYLKYRQNIITDTQIKQYILEYIDDIYIELQSVLGKRFIWHTSIFKEELKKNITRKILRMNKIEKQRQELPYKDILDNIQTAFMSALYMYFRYIYNDRELLKKEEDLAIALFVFIRNYSYSGMFRYNDKGDFNVPYGGIGYNGKTLDKKIIYYQSSKLISHLEKTTISNLDFEDFFDKYQPSEKDFIFIDPPYDTEFSTYAQNEFTKEDQKRLSNYLCNKCKAKWMLIIKYTPFVYSLYNHPKLKIKSFDKKYLVSFMNRNNKQAEHLLITNY